MTHNEQQKVISKLAEFDGWAHVARLESGAYIGRKNGLDFDLPSYLTSLDALQPILVKLSDEQWDDFLYKICGNAPGARWLTFEQLRHILTLPASTLASAIAAVI